MPNLARDILSLAIQARIPTMIWGPPGTAKTASVISIAQDLGWHLETVIASLRQPEDFAGLPVLINENDAKTVRFAPPAWAKNIVDKGGGIIFFDEITMAPPAVQKALLRPVLEGVVGDLALPLDKTSFVLAGNPPGTVADSIGLLVAPLSNRVLHLNWVLPVKEWAELARTGFQNGHYPLLPKDWETPFPRCLSMVASFLERRPSLALQVPKEDQDLSNPWPSFRSWTLAARAWAAMQSGRRADLAQMTIAGCVGEGPAVEFLSWIGAQDLPDPEEILKDPDGFVVPKSLDKVQIIGNDIVQAVINNTTPERWTAVWKVLYKIFKAGMKDVTVGLARTLTKHVGVTHSDLPKIKESIEIANFIISIKKDFDS